MWTKSFNRSVIYLYCLLITWVPGQYLIPANCESLADNASSSDMNAALVAKGIQAFNHFHPNGAERLFKTALEISRKSDDKPVTIEMLHNLARTDELLAKYNQAEAYLASAVVCSDSIKGVTRNAILADSLAKLSAFDLSMADYGNARVEVQKCLSLVGDDNESAGVKAKALNILAQLDLAEGQWQKGRDNIDSCLLLTKRVFGRNSLQYAEALNTSAMSHVVLGDDENSLQELSTALACSLLSEENPERDIVRINSFVNLAQTCLNLLHTKEALQAAQSALDLSSTKFGGTNPITAHCLLMCGLAYLQSSDLESAKRYLDMSLLISKAKLPTNHPEICLILYQLALCTILQNNSRQAEAYCADAARLKPDLVGNIITYECKQSLAQYFWNHGNIISGFLLGGWQIATGRSQILHTPVGRLSRELLLHNNNGRDTLVQRVLSWAPLTVSGLVLIVVFAGIIGATARVTLDQGGTGSGSILRLLGNAGSESGVVEYTLANPVKKLTHHPMYEHRKRGLANWLISRKTLH